ncbi:DMT family transporter [Streptomyces sp. NBC_00083]|uniref:DMT family transporter n=1 Tax=Streptomyces sp. NBC_00083 TaxID=2975647 RepID=UPI00225A1460|nr:EamA family transporter [Streptomyces sp. NBC_00083]MCX5382356.1 DMT family transporter [Streptomyces sp. NBC_00083]
MSLDASTARGSICAATAMVAVGSSAAVSPVLTEYPLLSGQAWRYVVAGLLLLLARRGASAPGVRLTPRQWARIALLAATGMAGFNVCLLEAVQRADPSTVGAVVGAAPVVLAVAGPLGSAQRPSARIAFSALVTTAGVCVIQAFGHGSLTGLLYALGALACECCFSLLAVGLLPALGPRRLSAFACLAAAPMLAVAAAVTEGAGALQQPTAAEWLALGYLTLVVTALAFFLWYAGIGLLGVDRAGLFAGVVPLTAVLLGPLLGTSHLAPTSVIGALVIGAAVLYGVSAPEPGRPR